MKFLSVLLLVVTMNQAFADSEADAKWIDSTIRNSIQEHGLTVTEKEMIKPGFGINSITGVPLTILTLGHHRKSNIRVDVSTGEEEGTVTCTVVKDTLNWELLIHNCRLSGITNIPASAEIKKGKLVWPQREGYEIMLGFAK